MIKYNEKAVKNKIYSQLSEFKFEGVSNMVKQLFAKKLTPTWKTKYQTENENFYKLLN